MLISGLRVVQEITRTRNPQSNPAWIEAMQRTSAVLFVPIAQKLVFRFVDPFHTISGYGLFRVMTTERREIVIELSSDNGLQWRELEFRHKPGEIDRRPSFTGFHMPRLDWQMWFASLERQPPNWIYYFLKRVLDGSDSVRYLLADSGDQAVPQLVRIVYYRYEFTKASGLQTSWWKRRTIYHLESYRLEDFR